MIIVTGGAGLIGSAVIWKLNRQGRDDIIVVDHLGSGEKWRNLAPLSFRDYFEKDDFLRAVTRQGNDMFRSVDAVIHLGACSSTTETDVSYLIDNNFRYSKMMALFALERGARFVYASSAATYGEGDLGFSESVALERLRPLNGYGYSKHIFDRWLQGEGLLERVAGVKYFNVFGPNEHHKGDMRSLVLKAFHQIRSTGRMSLFRSHRPEYADGEQLRDFVYVKDAVDMTLFLMEHQEAGGLFNAGSGSACSWNRLARALFAALGQEPVIDYVDMPEQIRERYQYHTCADVGRLRRAGYDRPGTSLEDAVHDYVTEYLIPGRYLGDEN